MISRPNVAAIFTSSTVRPVVDYMALSSGYFASMSGTADAFTLVATADGNTVGSASIVVNNVPIYVVFSSAAQNPPGVVVSGSFDYLDDLLVSTRSGEAVVVDNMAMAIVPPVDTPST